MSAELNLASRPFRNERLPRVLTWLLALTALGATAWHVSELMALSSAETQERRQEASRLESELARGRSEQDAAHGPEPGREQRQGWAAVKAIVDRRAFSWTRLMARLEHSLPREVKLTSIAPTTEAGEVTLEITAVARTVEDGLALVSAFESQPEFSDVRPQRLADEPEARAVSLQYQMRYDPLAVPTPSPALAASPKAEEEAAASGRPGGERGRESQAVGVRGRQP